MSISEESMKILINNSLTLYIKCGWESFDYTHELQTTINKFIR
jgi:hypothetical protein